MRESKLARRIQAETGCAYVVALTRVRHAVDHLQNCGRSRKEALLQLADVHPLVLGLEVRK